MGVVSSARRSATHPVIGRLVAAPGGYELFQALALLEAASPGSAPIGETAEPDREAVRLRGHIGAAFPSTDVAHVALEDRAIVDVDAMSLVGAFGPLPTPYARRLADGAMRGDAAMRDFLDIFNHRLIALMLRAHRRSRVAPEYADGRRASPLEAPLRALLGLGEATARIALGALPASAPAGLTPFSLFPHVGALSRPIANQDALERMLAEHFRVDVEVEPLQGRRRALEPRDLTYLGRRGGNTALGRETVVGRHIFDPAAGLRVAAGPLKFARFLDFLPGRPGAAALEAMCATYVGPGVVLDLRLKLGVGEARASRLPSRVPESAASSRPEAAPLLGQTSWIGRPRGAAEVVVRLGAAPPPAPRDPAPRPPVGEHRPGSVKALQAAIAAHFP